MMAEHTCQHEHTKRRDIRIPMIMGRFLVKFTSRGNLLYSGAVYFESMGKDGVYFAAVLLAGYHITWEGIEDTVKAQESIGALRQMYIY